MAQIANRRGRPQERVGSRAAQLLVEWMRTRGESQTDVAERLGCGRDRVQRLLSGEATPLVPEALVIQGVTGIAVSLWVERPEG